jgi:hypothetical protein
MSKTLFESVARAMVQAQGPDLAPDRLAQTLPDLAEDIWSAWSQERDDERRKEELLTIARATQDEVRRQIGEVVQEVAGDQPAEVKKLLTNYLGGMPATIRNLLRPVDPHAPTKNLDLSLQQAADLLRLLPTRVARLQVGDRPLPGIDLELIELLGVGGFAEVWKARNPHFDGMPPVALKFCLERAARDRLLRHEAAVLNQVMRQGRHPGIVPLLRTYLTNDPPCLEYEYVDGGDLTSLLREWRQLDVGRSMKLATRVMAKLAEIVAFAHRLSPPIVHRDLKPANILV